MRKKDLTGQVYGQLTVLGQGEHIGKCVAWQCKCSCGGVSLVTTGRLQSGNTRSCGCQKYSGLEPYHAVKHGQTVGGVTSRTYWIWGAMVQRCTNPKARAYHKYGGRGIKVCKRWLDFSKFFADMGERPKGKSLERRHNNKGYSSSNCYWATPLQQGANTRQNRWITVSGKKLHLAAWARELGVGSSTLSRWLDKEGAQAISRRL